MARRRRAAARGSSTTSSEASSSSSAERLAGPVDELHVTAPFYDREAGALEDALRAIDAAASVGIPRQPARASTGRRWPACSRAPARDVTVYAVEPQEFVHAKLIGVIDGDRGRAAQRLRATFRTPR